ncbi:MAG: ATP-dependent DNA ligase [Candidatus Pacearchaeota archaeon]
MEYKTLAKTYEEAESTTKRLEKTRIISDFLKKLDKEESDTLYLLLGDIYPQYDERKIGISEKLAVKAIAKASGNTEKEVEKKWKEIGDLGEVTEKLAKKKKQSMLTESHRLNLKTVIEKLRKLPEMEGSGMIDKKISLITELLSDAAPLEAKYLIRTLIGDLRIGIQESTVRDGLAEAFFPEEEKAGEAIQSAIDKSNDLGKVFETCKTQNALANLKKISLEVGKPTKVMLAQKAPSIESAFETVGKPAVIEYKYDGFRLLIHKKKDKVWLFTRRLENVTKQFPEVVQYIQNYIDAETAVLDCEAVGYNKETKKYTPFQEISQRIKRKYNIEKLSEELPVEVNVFDILYADGDSLLEEPFSERSKKLRDIVKTKKNKIKPSKQTITEDTKKAKEFYKEALKDNQEGIIIKNQNAKYQPGSRVGHMLKLKPEEKDMDLVITGAEYGTGKRSGWLSSFILSCYDENSGEFPQIGKVATGVKEKDDSSASGPSLNELTDKLKPLITKESGREAEIKPKVVVAVTYQEIQKSPTYSSGWALRFPRITAIREDKPVEEIADLEEVEQEHKRQEGDFNK